MPRWQRATRTVSTLIELLRLHATILVMAALLGCSNRAEQADRGVSPDLSRITAEQWQALSQRTVYFGHQSVGVNIVDGIRELAAQNPQVQIKISTGAAADRGPGLVEFLVGENTDPDSKNRAFLAATQGRLDPGSVLMFKYCYVDIDENTDASALFEGYRQTVAALRARHPDAIVVHVTMPLTADAPLRNWVNMLRGRPTRLTWNGVRSRYNELLRAAYEGREPVYDLAAAEATRSDGSLQYSVVEGHKVFAMADEWTSDGGHLNAAGRQRAAAQFLTTLASLPSSAGR